MSDGLINGMITIISKLFDGLFKYFSGEDAYYYVNAIAGSIILFGGLILSLICLYWLILQLKLSAINRKLSQTKNRQEFYEQYEEIDDYFQKTIFAYQWREYCESLIRDKSHQDKEILNTLRPYEFFHCQDLKYSPKSFAVFPNLFVGVGLLFTFIGLAAAISEASHGMQGGVESALASLQGVLSAAKLKFLTSISGLGCSIIIGLAIRITTASLKTSVEKLCVHLEKLVKYQSPQDIYIKQLDKLNEISNAQKTFVDDLSMKIGEVLENKLTQSFQVAISPLNNAIKEQLAKADERGESSVIQMVQKLGDQIQSGAGEQMAAIASSLAQVGEILHETTNTLSNSLATGGEKVAKQLNAAGAGFAQDVGDIVQSLANSVALFDENIDKFDDKIQRHAAIIDQNMNIMQKILPEVSKTIEVIRGSASPIAQTAQGLAEAAKDISETSDNFSNATEQIKLAINKIENMQESITKVWDEYRNRFEDVDEILGRTFQEFSENMQQSQEVMKNFIKEINDGAASVANALNQNISELSESIEEYNELRNGTR